MSGRQTGGALPSVLILLLALTGLAYGILGLSISELRTQSSARHIARATAGAKAGAVRGFQVLDSLLQDTIRYLDESLGAGATPEGITYAARLRWLGREYFLLEATGGSSDWPGERRVGWVGWALDPISRMADFRAGIETGGSLEIGIGAGFSIALAGTDELGWPEGTCEPVQAAVDSLFGARPLPGWGSRPPEPVAEGSGGAIPALGLLTGPRLLERAIEDGRTFPEPGGPLQGGCSGLQESVLWISEGAMSLSGGSWCGVAVISGDLTLGPNSHFQGVALVGGDFTIARGGRLDGMAKVGGTVIVADGGNLLISPCAALLALTRTYALHRPLLLPDGHRIGGF